MRRTITLRIAWPVLAAGCLTLGCTGVPEPESAETSVASEPVSTSAIDQRSYDLGVIGAFGEVVSYGIKTLALSAALAPDDMAALLDEAGRVAERNGVLLHLEEDLIVTDLFPPDVATGKHVLLIYTGSTKDDYFALKADKAALEADGRYEGEARVDIARRFGRMLSYPDETIDEMLSRSGQ